MMQSPDSLNQTYPSILKPDQWYLAICAMFEICDNKFCNLGQYNSTGEADACGQPNHISLFLLQIAPGC